jgi:hypothetical protein
MAKARFIHPRAFVACPYGGKFPFARFKKALNFLPLRFVYADSQIKTQQLLERVRGEIAKSDYALFDVTGWNPNVTLELGLADGLNKNYYILYNQKKKSEVPADIRGLQRFGYNKIDSGENSLILQLAEHLVKQLTHPRRVFDRLTPQHKLKKFTYAMGVLALLRDHKNVRRKDLKQVPKYRLRQRDREEALDALLDAKIVNERAGRLRLKKNLYGHTN